MSTIENYSPEDLPPRVISYDFRGDWFRYQDENYTRLIRISYFREILLDNYLTIYTTTGCHELLVSEEIASDIIDKITSHID